jgi:hypothetical protein
MIGFISLSWQLSIFYFLWGPGRRFILTLYSFLFRSSQERRTEEEQAVYIILLSGEPGIEAQANLLLIPIAPKPTVS